MINGRYIDRFLSFVVQEDQILGAAAIAAGAVASCQPGPASQKASTAQQPVSPEPSDRRRPRRRGQVHAPPAVITRGWRS